jgi:CRP/FNR family transcriptional regulator
METYELIRKVFSFSEKELIKEIMEASELHELVSGESIQGEGDYIKSFPMVIKGCIRVVRLSESGRELLLYYLRAGEICSMSLTCCMVPQKSKIKMVAEEDSVILTIPVEKPEKWMSEYKSWKVLMMNSYRHRFDELLGTIDSLTFMKMDERLIRFFKERYRYTNKTHFSGTHEDIANQLNTSREVISRLLKKMELMNLVVTERNSIDYSDLVKK